MWKRIVKWLGEKVGRKEEKITLVVETKVVNLTVAKENGTKTRKRIKVKERMIRRTRTRLHPLWGSKETIAKSIVSNVGTPSISQENARRQVHSHVLCIQTPQVMIVRLVTLGGRLTICRWHPPDHPQEKGRKKHPQGLKIETQTQDHQVHRI